MSASAGNATSEAYQSLNALVETLHEQGLLDLARNAVATHPQWTATVGRMAGDFVGREKLADTVPAVVAFARLLGELHRQGLLDLARNLVATHPQWMATLGGILDDATRGQDGRRLLDNLSVIAGALSRIEPGQLSRFSSAAAECLACAAQEKPAAATPPGLIGMYRMCRDEALWRALAPMMDAMKTFGRTMDQKAG